MASPATAERTEAPGAAVASPRRLMSPLGYVVVVAIMGVTAGVVYFVTRNFHDTGQKSVIHEAYEEIDLGQVTRELAPDANLVREQFMVKIVLLLNPNNKNLAELKPQVEKRRNLLKHIVLTEIVYRKSDAELRNPDILEMLGNELRQRLNAEFDTAKDGQEAIHKVIFPDSRLPSHH
jgi:flagellar basal body-associated protein FliL